MGKKWNVETKSGYKEYYRCNTDVDNKYQRRNIDKQYFCAHVIIVAVGLQLVTIPENCKNVNIGNLKKKGDPLML